MQQAKKPRASTAGKSLVSNFLSYHTVIFTHCFVYHVQITLRERATAQISVCGRVLGDSEWCGATHCVRALVIVYIYVVPHYINFPSAVCRNVRREVLG